MHASQCHKMEGAVLAQHNSVRILSLAMSEICGYLIVHIFGSDHIFLGEFFGIFLELQKQFFFLSGQALPPPPPLSGRATEKQLLLFLRLPLVRRKQPYFGLKNISKYIMYMHFFISLSPRPTHVMINPERKMVKPQIYTGNIYGLKFFVIY